MATFVAQLQKSEHKMRKNRPYIFSLIIALLALTTCIPTSMAQTVACTARPPKHEVRAVWLTTIGGIDWPHTYAQSARSIEKQQNELRQILDQLQAAGINTVLLQTRVRGTVIYPSAYEPWDGCLSGHPGKSPGYDALQFAINECHRRGMELHAWIVTMPVGKWDALGCKQLRKKMPRNIIRIKADGYMNPETQQTADYLAGICAEVTRAYDVDGIHLDYIRYPEELPKLKTMSRDKGRDNITRIVRTISRRVKSIKPWVKMSCSPIGKYDDTQRYWSRGWNANTKVCQDAELWLRDGLMDELFPMMYFRDNDFFPFALDWKERSHGRIIVPGLGIYFMSPRERDWPLSDITRELEFLRAEGLGHAYFRSKFFTDNTKGIYQYARNEYSQYASLVPPMTWQSNARPATPQNLSIMPNGHGTATVSWRHTVADTTMMLFNVYGSTEYPVDTDDARNLIATRRQSRQLTIPDNSCMYYAVCATDRYGNESAPLQQPCDDFIAPVGSSCCNKSINHKAMLPCDGHNVTLPKYTALTDADFLIVESIQHTAITTLPYRRTSTINVNTLPQGVYVLRTLNRKGVSPRVGMFRK